MKRSAFAQKGFTMVELLIAGFLSMVVIMIIYLVFIGSSRQYSIQEQIVGMHESMRFSVDFLKTELRGAGRLSIVNGREKNGAPSGLGVRDPSYCPSREGLQAIELFENDRETPTILSGAPNGLAPDRLRVLKDTPGAVPLTIHRIKGRSVQLQAAAQQATESARTFAKSDDRTRRAFAPGHYLYILSRSGLSDLLPITDIRFNEAGSTIDLTEQPCDMPGMSLISQCAFSGCIASPVQLLEYRVDSVADSAVTTQLVRHVKDARSPEEDLDNQGLVLASHVVDFQVMGLLDLRPPAELQLTESGANNEPKIQQDDDPRDDRGNAEGDSESEAINERPEKIRSLKIVLAVRTAREDPQFTVAIDKTVSADQRQPSERTWFELDKAPESGYARVTTLSFEVETPNLYRGQ